MAWLRARIGPERPDYEPDRTRLQKDVVYDPEHGLKLDAWVPAGRGPFPAVVIAHGGGWEAGDKVTYITPLFAPLTDAAASRGSRSTTGSPRRSATPTRWTTCAARWPFVRGATPGDSTSIPPGWR